MKKFLVGALTLGTMMSVGLGTATASAAEEQQGTAEVDLTIKERAEYVLTIPASKTVNPDRLVANKYFDLGRYFVTGTVDSAHKVQVDVSNDSNFVHENGKDVVNYRYVDFMWNNTGTEDHWWTNDQMQPESQKERQTQLEFSKSELDKAKPGKYSATFTFKARVVEN